MPEKTYLQAISDGLRQEMQRDKRVFVIGEDVGVYGGAFKVTLGFLAACGGREGIVCGGKMLPGPVATVRRDHAHSGNLPSPFA